MAEAITKKGVEPQIEWKSICEDILSSFQNYIPCETMIGKLIRESILYSEEFINERILEYFLAKYSMFRMMDSIEARFLYQDDLRWIGVCLSIAAFLRHSSNMIEERFNDIEEMKQKLARRLMRFYDGSVQNAEYELRQFVRICGLAMECTKTGCIKPYNGNNEDFNRICSYYQRRIRKYEKEAKQKRIYDRVHYVEYEARFRPYVIMEELMFSPHPDLWTKTGCFENILSNVLYDSIRNRSEWSNVLDIISRADNDSTFEEYQRRYYCFNDEFDETTNVYFKGSRVTG